MKTVTVTNRSREMKRLLQLAEKEDVVVRTPDGSEYMVSRVDDFAYEIAMQRNNKKLMAFLDRRFREAEQEEALPLEEVSRQLGLNTNGGKVSRRKTSSHPRRPARR